VDLSQLLLIAARVLGVTADELVRDLDIGKVRSCLDDAMAMMTADPTRQASALVHAIVRTRPFGDGSDAVAILAAAHMLDEAGVTVTFEPTQSLFDLLARIRSDDASVDDVVDFVLSQTRAPKGKTDMFERFTPRAHQALSEAKHAAEALQHNFMGTEHLLLGVLAVEEGVGAQVLRDFGVAADDVKRRVEALVGPGPKAVVNQFPFTPRSKKALELALRHALNLGQSYIGTEHILLGILEVREGIAARVLEGMGVTRARAEDQTISILVSQGWTPPSKKARRRARHMALTGFALDPMSPAATVRNQRLVNEMTTVIAENDALRAELGRLRRLLSEHNIDPGVAGAGEQSAS
jgi:hypothetical protein